MNAKLMSYGVAAVVTIALLKMVFEFIVTITKKETPTNVARCLDAGAMVEMRNQVKKLWEIHDKYTEDGAPKWYFPYTLMNSILDELKEIKDKLP